MAVAYSYDEQTHILRIVGEGIVNLSDRVDLVFRILADPLLPAWAALLVNVSEVKNAPTPEEVRVIGILIDRLCSRFNGRTAIVNVTVGHVAISHMAALSAYNASDNVRVFSSEVAATEWLLAT